MRKVIMGLGTAFFLGWTLPASAQMTNPFAGTFSPKSSLPVVSTPTSSSTMSSFFMGSMTNKSFNSAMYAKPQMAQQINVGFLNFLPKMPNMTSTFLFRNSGTLTAPTASAPGQVTPPPTK